MKRTIFTIVAVSCIMSIGLITWPAAADDGSPKQIAKRFLEGGLRGQGEAAARLVHHDAYEQFRIMILSAASEAYKAGQEHILLGAFPGVETIDELMEMPARDLFVTFATNDGASDPIMRQVMSTTQVEVIGSVRDDDMTHVVVRLTLRNGAATFEEVELVMLARDSDNWRVQLSAAHLEMLIRAAIANQVAMANNTAGDVSQLGGVTPQL
jgi:hypothetical protein